MSYNREELSAVIYKVNKLLKIQMQNILKNFDITTDQWIVLGKIVHNSGNYNQRDLAEACFKERAAITRMLDIMEKKGLIERRDSASDRREYILYATEKGMKLYEATSVPVQEAEEHVNDILEKDELEKVISLMAKLEEGLSGK